MASLSAFADAAEYASSDYWKHMLMDASTGRFPASYSYRDGVVMYRSKRKSAKPEKLVCPHDPQALATAVQSFFRTTSGIMSEEDQHTFAHKHEEIIPTKWSQVRSVGQKKQLLEHYVLAECDKVGLSLKERKKAMQTLNLGFCLGAFPNVQMAEGRVVNVEGFNYDSEHKRFGFKKPKGKQRKPVETDEVLDEDHVMNDSIFIKPWVRLMRILFRISDDVNTSALPSIAENPPIFMKH
jgi:hypothetical protein